jgi:hypothetical protein
MEYGTRYVQGVHCYTIDHLENDPDCPATTQSSGGARLTEPLLHPFYIPFTPHL